VAYEPDWLVETVLVVERFKHLAAQERENPVRLAAEIAEEYGLVADTRPDGDSIAIWFCRDRPPGAEQADTHLALVASDEKEIEEHVGVSQ
jgi:hypothetical protein